MLESPLRRALTLAAFPAVAWIIDVNEKAGGRSISGQRLGGFKCQTRDDDNRKMDISLTDQAVNDAANFD
jgi:hypothetical protein